jgi:hypothetical protein
MRQFVRADLRVFAPLAGFAGLGAIAFDFAFLAGVARVGFTLAALEA